MDDYRGELEQRPMWLLKPSVWKLLEITFMQSLIQTQQESIQRRNTACDCLHKNTVFIDQNLYLKYLQFSKFSNITLAFR